LLAVAAELAAPEGMQPPTALTFRYPGDPAADETSWQELVVAHLHSACLRFEWVRRDITTELDNIGPVMAPVLRAHSGPTFPAGLANTILLAQHASGGSLVTGNAGDEVLGGHRAGVLRAVLRRRGRGLTRANWRQTAACAAPAPLRRRRARRDVDDALWLRPVLHRAVLAEWMRSQVARPLRWDRSVWSALAPRAVLIGNRTRARVAQDHDCELTEPLGSPGFVASYAASRRRHRPPPEGIFHRRVPSTCQTNNRTAPAEQIGPAGAAPSGPIAAICDNQIPGSAAAPAGGVVVDTAVDDELAAKTKANPPGTTFWLAPGKHTPGRDQYGQVAPKDGSRLRFDSWRGYSSKAIRAQTCESP